MLDRGGSSESHDREKDDCNKTTEHARADVQLSIKFKRYFSFDPRAYDHRYPAQNWIRKSSLRRFRSVYSLVSSLRMWRKDHFDGFLDRISTVFRLDGHENDISQPVI